MTQRLLSTALVLTMLQAAASQAQEAAPQPGTPDDARAAWSDPFESLHAVRVITAEDIWRSNAANLPDLLRQEAAAWMTFAGHAGGSPVIRGLSGSSVLILLDGLKINTTAYRFGPAEYLSTIDLLALERIEIVGGNAGAYSGDTLGPVIRLYTKRSAEPLSPGSRPPDDATARLYYRYASVDEGSISHLEAHRQEDRYSLFFGLTSRGINDLKVGGDLSRLLETGYLEIAGNLRGQYFFGDHQTVDVAVMILEQDGVPIYNRLADGSHLQYEIDPRKREQFRISFLDNKPRLWSERVEASVYINQHRQTAFEQLSEFPQTRLQTSDTNDVSGFMAGGETALGDAHRLTWSGEYRKEIVSAVIRETDVLTGEEIFQDPDPTRNDQNRTQLLLRIEDHFQIRPDLALELGAGYSSASISGSQQTDIGTLALGASDSGIAGFLSLAWRPVDSLAVVASYDTGFLLPGIDEVTSFSGGPSLSSLPNPDLVAATADAYELGLHYRTGSVFASATYFSQRLGDLPRLLPAEVNGLTYTDLDGDGQQGPDEPSLVRTVNAGEAEIDGFELQAQVELPYGIELFGSIIKTTGDDRTTGEPLPAIPPTYGSFGLGWKGTQSWAPWVRARILFSDDKTRLNPLDLENPDFDPLWLDGSSLFGLQMGATLSTRIRLALKLQNLADESYKTFGSALWSPGSNIVLSGEYVF